LVFKWGQLETRLTNSSKSPSLGDYLMSIIDATGSERGGG